LDQKVSIYNNNPPHHQFTKQTSKVKKIAIGFLIGVLLFGIFMVGFDQGHLFDIARGRQEEKKYIYYRAKLQQILSSQMTFMCWPI
jgi:hypothetical protein